MSEALGCTIVKLINNDYYYLTEALKEGDLSDYIEHKPSNIDVCFVWTPALDTAINFSGEESAKLFARKHGVRSFMTKLYYPEDVNY